MEFRQDFVGPLRACMGVSMGGVVMLQILAPKSRGETLKEVLKPYCEPHFVLIEATS